MRRRRDERRAHRWVVRVLRAPRPEPSPVVPLECGFPLFPTVPARDGKFLTVDCAPRIVQLDSCIQVGPTTSSRRPTAGDLPRHTVRHFLALDSLGQTSSPLVDLLSLSQANLRPGWSAVLGPPIHGGKEEMTLETEKSSSAEGPMAQRMLQVLFFTHLFCTPI